MSDEDRKKLAAEHHELAMNLADRADEWCRCKGDLALLASTCLLTAARSEFDAALEISRMKTPPEPARSVFFRSAAALARQASVALAEEGLRGSPDAKLRAELEELCESHDSVQVTRSVRKTGPK